MTIAPVLMPGACTGKPSLWAEKLVGGKAAKWQVQDVLGLPRRVNLLS